MIALLCLETRTNALRFKQSEYAVLGTVFSTLSTSQKSPLYASLLPLPLSLFSQTSSNLNTLIKKSLHPLIPIAFASFSELSERNGEYEEVVRKKSGRKENELGESLHSFRGTCLSSLPGMIEDVKVRIDTSHTSLRW